MKKIGVCMITGSFYPDISGGGIQALNLMRRLRDKINFTVLTGCIDYSLASQDEVEGFKVFRLKMKRDNFISKLLAGLNIIRILSKLRKDIDILHLHGFTKKNLVIMIWAKFFKKKVIQKISALGADDPFTFQKNKHSRFAFKAFSKCDVFIATTPDIAKTFGNSILQEKVKVVPNGVDIERFSPVESLEKKRELRKRLKIPENEIVFIFVGALYYEKGVDLFIAAADYLAKIRGDLTFIFIGNSHSSYFLNRGTNYQETQKILALQRKKKKNIFLHNITDMQDYYRASDIFILPSRQEGLPNALLEAMSSALACITSRAGGVSDYVVKHGSNGLVMETESASDLIKNIGLLLNNGSLRQELGIRAREKAVNNFSLDIISGRYLEIYNKLKLLNED